MRELLRFLFANGWLKLLSVAAAVGIWLWVQGAEIEESRLSAQVVWSFPTQLVPAVPPPTTVTLTVKGTRAAARVARAGTVRMVVDVSQMPRGNRQVDLSTMPIEGLPKTLERAAVSPAVVDLALEERATRKLKVRPDVVGDVADGFAVAAVSIEPERVEVAGPRSAIDALSGLVTRPIDVTGLSVTTMRPVDLDLPQGVAAVGEVALAARIEVASRIERREIADVPVFVRGSDRLFVASPEVLTVSVEGPANELARLDAGRVAAFVVLPQGAGKDRYEAWLGQQKSGVRVEVLHGGGELVKVTAIAPPSVVVEVP